MPFVAQPTEKCTACGKTVYATEKTVVDDKEIKKIYHKTCIRCKECNKVLLLGQYSALDGVFYCKPHFKQLFASKGNYDESFGKEKASSKWTGEGAPTSPPTSFIPESRDEIQSEKKQTSEATLAKFRQFREEGESNKCSSCDKTVYQAEKLLVENKDGKLLFHKSCFKCCVCNLSLDLRNYGSVGEKIYCKNHLKEVSNISSPATTQFVPGSGSFIPPTESEPIKKADKNQTSEATAALFKKFREEGDSNKCTSCSKTVYAAEKLLVEGKNGKMLFHKACFKCNTCEIALDLRNYGSIDDKVFCKNHLKEEEGNARTRSGSYAPAVKSFIPDVEKSEVSQKSETPSHIAEKFKGLGSGGEKCKSCGKTVYATEKLVVEELKGQSIFHKACLRCSKCNIQLDISTFGSSQGIIYCKVHLKEFGKPEQAKDGGFISPLAQIDGKYQAGPKDDESSGYGNSAENSPQVQRREIEQESEPEKEREEEREPEREREEEREPEKETPVDSPSVSRNVRDSPASSPSVSRRSQRNLNENSTEEEDPKKRERRLREEERARQQEEEERRYEEEKQKRRARLTESSNSLDSVGSSDTGDSREDERRRRREEREKERIEEEKKFQEEKERREREREEKRRQRELEEQKEEEEMARRKQEREERRRQQEEEARREEEEAERRAEERKKRLEAISS